MIPDIIGKGKRREPESTRRKRHEKGWMILTRKKGDKNKEREIIGNRGIMQRECGTRSVEIYVRRDFISRTEKRWSGSSSCARLKVLRRMWNWLETAEG